MRFTNQKDLCDAYFNGQKKTVTKFLWWPITVADNETRWLERATIVYKADYEQGLFSGRNYYWKPWEFID